MAGSVSLSYTGALTVIETLDQALVPDAADANRKITHNAYNTNGLSLSGSTTPPVSLCASFVKALSSGTGTIDLTALVGTNGVAVDGTGLKVRAFKFINPATNANPITIKFGAANPYNLLGASWQIVLAPGQEAQSYLKDGAPVVGSGAKNIDLSGTGTQALQCQVVLG